MNRCITSSIFFLHLLDDYMIPPPFLKIYLFIFGCVGSSLLHAGFLQLRQAGATLRCSVWASPCGGFSCCGAWALERRLSSCGARAQFLRGMWDLPGPGLEPLSPALAGGFPTTVPPGKSLLPFLNIVNLLIDFQMLNQLYFPGVSPTWS